MYEWFGEGVEFFNATTGESVKACISPNAGTNVSLTCVFTFHDHSYTNTVVFYEGGDNFYDSQETTLPKTKLLALTIDGLENGATILLENAYTNHLGVVVPARSNESTLQCSYSIPANATILLSASDDGNSRFEVCSGGNIVQLPVSWNSEDYPGGRIFTVRGKRHSAFANSDIFTATLECGSAIASANACFTMLGARLQADAIWPTNRVRHVFGPAEAATLSVEPAVPACSLDFNAMPEGFVVTNIAGNLWRLAMPHAPASFTGHIRHNGNSFPIQLQTIAPIPPLVASNPTPISFQEGSMAAGFDVNVNVMPDYVSFAQITLVEGSATATNRCGIFAHPLFDRAFDHNTNAGAGVNIPLSISNGLADHIRLEINADIASCLYNTNGYVETDIPVSWFVKGSSVTNNFAVNTHCNGLSPGGIAGVGKYGITITRGTNDVSTISL